jgi:hypothetical protein
MGTTSVYSPTRRGGGRIVVGDDRELVDTVGAVAGRRNEVSPGRG